MATRRQASRIAALAVALNLPLAAGYGESRDAPGAAAGPLQEVTAFDSIADGAARSQALFVEAGRVLQHPRCLNCHPADAHPRRGETLLFHEPPVARGDDGHGVASSRCITCHQQENLDHARLPGHPDWHLAPVEMGWVGEPLAAESVVVPAGAARVDAAGQYLLPGLWDLHTHLAMLDDHAPRLLVTQGVLGVRDMGAVPGQIEALRARVESGELMGPRIVRVGPTLNGAPNGVHHRVIESPEAARAAVAELAAAGFDLIKTHNATGRETYFALLAAARDAGLTVAGHVPVTVTPLEACAAGQASIEHIATLFEGTYLAGFESEMAAFLGMPDWLAGEAVELADCFAEHGTLFVPTLRAYEVRAHWAAEYDHPNPARRYLSAAEQAKWRETAEPTEIDRRDDVIRLRESLVDTGIGFVRLLHERGAAIGAGTDVASPGLVPGFDLHAEIRLLARAGLTPAEALRTATRGPGADAGGDPLQGRLVAGAPADLVLLRRDAFADLAALDSIEGVVLRGKLLSRAELDRVLSELEED